MGLSVGILALSACLSVWQGHFGTQNISTCCSLLAVSVRQSAESSPPARHAGFTLLYQCVVCQLHLLL